MSIDAELLASIGAIAAIFLCSLGSCLASAQAGLFAMQQSRMGKLKLIPIIIAGVLSIYGLIVAVLLQGKIFHSDDTSMTLKEGYRYMAAGCSVGLACLSSGLGIAKFLAEQIKTPMRMDTVTQESEPLIRETGGNITTRSFLTLVLVLVFLEAIGLYGLIVALFLIGK